jgi:ELWxxDGT repeat protein
MAYNLGYADDEIWKSDGSNAGTTEVMDIYPGAPDVKQIHLFCYQTGV